MKIIARIKGGLGNQLFSYAAARRLAIANGAELVIDHVTGFTYDYEYRRKYALDHFLLPCRKATALERLEPFGRYRRALQERLAHRYPFHERRFIEQEFLEFDSRLLGIKVDRTTYIEGFWQSELYFKDIEDVLRRDFCIISPEDEANVRMAGKIRDVNAVALHVRWFDAPDDKDSAYNLMSPYYRNAVAYMERSLECPTYFVFSDNPDAVRNHLELPGDRTVLVSHNRGEFTAYADLWLMQQCRHFITANSTFSWWGAWLGKHTSKRVVTPRIKIDGRAAWGFEGLLPEAWIKL